MRRKLLYVSLFVVTGCHESAPETRDGSLATPEETIAAEKVPGVEDETTASEEEPVAPAELEPPDRRLSITAPAEGGEVPASSDPTSGDGKSNAKAPRVVASKVTVKGTDLGERRGLGGLGLRGVGRGGGGDSIHAIGNLASGSLGSGKGYGRGAALSHSLSSGSPAPGPVYREPSSAEDYKNHGTNEFTDPSEDRFSTFAVDVDTGSYTIARRKLNEGRMPPKDAVRVEEFVNYFRYSYPKPDGGPFSVSMEAAPSPFATSNHTYLMRVGVQGKTIAESQRKPVHLVFLVDVSGSMQSADKIELVKDSLITLTENLRDEDSVAIATYAGATQILLEPTTAKNRSQIMAAIQKLNAGGSTAMASGLELAYELADKGFERAHENRVIVLSDGDANVGRTSWQQMNAQISKYVKKGVTLSTIGFGMGNYKDTLMEQLANHGNGNYFYVDSKKEAQKVFGDQLDGTLQVIARDVKIQVEFNPDAVERYRLIGYENRDIADKDFRNDKVDAGEIGAGHTVTALYELVLKTELPERIATVRVRHKEPRGSDKAAEAAFALDRDELEKSIGDSSKDFQFAAAVCAFAEKLRHSPYAKGLTWDWIEEIASSATNGRADRKEMVELVKKARRSS